MEIANPIPMKIRGILLVIGIIFGGLSTITATLVIALAVPAVWVAVIVAAQGALLSTIGTLSRANLRDPQATTETTDQNPESDPAYDI